MESTAKLRRIQPPPAPGGAGDAEATQVLPPMTDAGPAGAYGVRPGTPADRPSLADFDSLFRAEPAGGPAAGRAAAPTGGADSTQRLPLFDQAAVTQDDHAPGARGGRVRRLPRVAVVGLVAAGCALAGLAAGAALDSGDKGGSQAQPQPSSSPAAGTEESPGEEETVRQQAEQLSRLLGESNNSRASVIQAVEHIKSCTKLEEAAADLRSAAQQRRDLVAKLKQLTLDRLPHHEALTAALTSAWQASARADAHYAAWADEVAGDKGCRKGRAVPTDQLAKGNAASGQATEAKKKAAGLWNPIAREYGLPERQITEL